jgi:hypothetical protein
MVKLEIRSGTHYAYREKRTPGSPFDRVKVIEHVRANKWKVEWVNPNPGLIDYVESVQLVAPWKEHKKVLKEENDRALMEEHNLKAGYVLKSPITNALSEIFESVGDEITFWGGSLRGKPEAIDRLKARVGQPPGKYAAFSYVDRQGLLFLPFDEALEIAKKFCAVEPQPVLVRIEAGERDWLQKARTLGEEYIVPLLNEYQAAWALIRQWTGHDPAIAAREDHIKKLERLVWDAIYALQKAGLDSESARLRRAIAGVGG